LHERTEITCTVSVLVPEKAFPHPDALVPGPAAQAWEMRTIASRKFLLRLLGEVTERKREALPVLGP